MQLGSNDLTYSDPFHFGYAIEEFFRLLHDIYLLGLSACLKS